MKLYVSEMGGGSAGSPLQMAIKLVGELVNELVDNIEEAEIIVTDSARTALACLKENETAEVVIFVAPREDSELNAARSLRKNFPGRATVAHLFEENINPGEVVLVPYLIIKGTGGER